MTTTATDHCGGAGAAFALLVDRRIPEATAAALRHRDASFDDCEPLDAHHGARLDPAHNQQERPTMKTLVSQEHGLSHRPYVVVHVDMYGAIHPVLPRRDPGPDHDPPFLSAAWSDLAARALRRLRRSAGAVALTLAATGLAVDGAWAQSSLLNVSYDPTRELYREFNEAFNAHWQALGNPAVEIQTSHGGSGSQARAVIDGLEAQVVTLALASDINAIAERSGKIPADWQSKFPHNSSPYTSTIVFLVREGNPKNLQDWGDLVAEGVQVITPNPKTSGGARWNYLAAWAWAEANGQDPQAFVGKLYANVPVLDTAARGSTTTFSQRGIGDVLLAWENEAYLALAELGEDRFDIVVPSVSVLAEPPVALVEGNIATDEQRALATAYLEYLYSPEGQALALKHFYRAWDTSAADPEDVARFPEVNLVGIDHFGGWGKAQPEHFGDGGVFDQIYDGQ